MNRKRGDVMTESLKTVRDLIRLTAEYLSAKGVESARLNAERLLGDVLGMSRLDLYLHHDRPLVADEVDRFRELVRRRAAGEPLQQLLGEAEFYGRSFKMARGVFIPRPETELLVESCLGLLTGDGSSLLAPVALEVGCGTGVIGITLAAEMPRLEVHASDIDPAARDLAEINARRLGVGPRTFFHLGALCDPFPGRLRGGVDLLVTNPPYIPSADVPDLPVEVADHDPRAALDGGPEGLDVYRSLAARAGAWLHRDGWLAAEIGADQGESVPEILARAGFRDITLRRDYNDLPRVVTARSPLPDEDANGG